MTEQVTALGLRLATILDPGWFVIALHVDGEWRRALVVRVGTKAA